MVLTGGDHHGTAYRLSDRTKLKEDMEEYEFKLVYLVPDFSRVLITLCASWFMHPFTSLAMRLSVSPSSPSTLPSPFALSYAVSTHRHPGILPTFSPLLPPHTPPFSP